jgi:hypothetical protein
MGVLKPRLELRAALAVESGERFSFPWSQGVLVGCQVRDTQCPDPQARNRHPTILRAVSIPCDVKPVVRDALFAALEALDAAAPGENGLLKIMVSAGELTGNQTCPRSLGSWTKWGLAMAIACIVGYGVWLFAQVHIGESAASGEMDQWAKKHTARKMDDLLRNKWKVEKMPEKQFDENIRKRFFTFLSQEEIGLPIEGQHPDKVFVRQRLLEQVPRDIDLHTLRGLHRALKMVSTSSDKPDSADDSRSLASLKDEIPELFRTIEARMDYRAWLKEWDSKRSPGISPWEEESADKLRQFIYHFVPPPEKRCLSREDAVAIVRQLRGWKITGVDEGDAEKRPWFVFHCYMTLLSQNSLKTTLEHDNSWHAAFARRLPRTADFVAIECDDEAELVEKGLRPLAKAIEAKQSTEVVSLVNSIARGLKYKEWLQGCEQRRADLIRKRDEGFQKSGYDNATKNEEVPPFGQVQIELVKGGKPTYTMTNVKEESQNKQVNDFVNRLQHEPVQKDTPARN